MFWPIAIFMIVIASWVIYRYLVPREWRDWTRAGLVQAFIIALYAEMYGFPVTLYILTRYPGRIPPRSGAWVLRVYSSASTSPIR